MLLLNSAYVPNVRMDFTSTHLYTVALVQHAHGGRGEGQTGKFALVPQFVVPENSSDTSITHFVFCSGSQLLRL